MLIEEAKILAIDDMLVLMDEVHSAVTKELTKNVSKYSKNRVLYGASVQHISVVNTLKLVQKELLERMASRSMMA